MLINLPDVKKKYKVGQSILSEIAINLRPVETRPMPKSSRNRNYYNEYEVEKFIRIKLKKTKKREQYKYSESLLIRKIPNYKLNRLISLNVYKDEKYFFAENKTLNICGTGETSDEAVKDAKIHISHFYEYYKKLEQDKLMGDALRLKELYKDLLIKK
jgi:hypothetical protein